ncbi:TetR/AcrR family transcriptional regulator [Paenibacillus guangzhouensis]|uniref:TetR/AcrR family transcriptional regulator n=1 Tax=Paenibacillus guangzhouensis TaxID=1473112 RepID=UPI001266B32A|nr:TetR/AcrR family transcriptional regulator [Paenibacillus guangzhouensis]
MRRRAYDAELTRANIITAARGLFANKGYTATSIDEICAVTGYSKGSLYYHFKSKEDLFVQLAEEAFLHSWEAWDERSSSYETTIDKLYAYADYFVDTLEKPLNKAGEDFIAKVGLESEVGQKFLAILMGYLARFETLVAEGVSSGEFRHENPKELAYILMSYYSGLSDSYRMMDKAAMKQLYRNATRLILEGLANPDHEVKR